jgi:hypothetical protein
MADPTPDDLPDPVPTGASVTRLRARLADPPVVARPAAAAADDPADPGPNPNSGRDGDTDDDIDIDPGNDRRSPRRPDRPRGEIWDGCPVRPLGVSGGFSYYLDALGQVRAVQKHEKQTIMHVFGNRLAALCWHFPQWGPPKRDGSRMRREGRFDADHAAQAMIQACAEKGLFDPDGAVRGPGAWTDEDGHLVYHCGDVVLTQGRALPPGPQGRVIYPAHPPIPPPAPSAEATDPVPPLQEELAGWRWRRGDTDAHIMLGALGCLMLGGALDWRPQFWITGQRTTGKSRLQSLIHMVMGGDRGLLKSENATAAAISNFLKLSTIPVALDELEPGPGSSAKEQAIVELLRQASSGGRRIRSNPDQRTHETIIRSTFLASSILVPGVLKPQDRSRIAVLDLEAFPEGSPKPPPLRAEVWRKRGAVLKRLLIDRWPSWGQRLELWREALAEHRIDQRNGDNWATILAMADMAIGADLPAAEVLTGWAARIATAVRDEIADIGSDSEDVVTHLLSQVIDPMRRGQQFTLGVWIKAAGRRPGAGDRLFGSDTLASSPDQRREEQGKKANQFLAAFGLRVEASQPVPVLLVATKSEFSGLRKLFDGSQWQGGAWSQSLKRLPGATSPRVPLRFDGNQSKVTAVPFTAIPGLLAFDDESPAEPAPMAAATQAYDPEGYA